MAFFDNTRTTYATASAVNRFSALAGTLIAKIVAWNDARVTRNALSELTDRELEDIGLSRADIDAVATSNVLR